MPRYSAGLQLYAVRGTSQHPELRWDPPLYHELLIDDFGLEHRYRLTGYDILIFSEEGDVVYRRIRVPTPPHRVEELLKAPAKYYWTVRPRFELNGAERVGPWTRSRAHDRDVFAHVDDHEVPIPLFRLARFNVSG